MDEGGRVISHDYRSDPGSHSFLSGRSFRYDHGDQESRGDLVDPESTHCDVRFLTREFLPEDRTSTLPGSSDASPTKRPDPCGGTTIFLEGTPYTRHTHPTSLTVSCPTGVGRSWFDD